MKNIPPSHKIAMLIALLGLFLINFYLTLYQSENVQSLSKNFKKDENPPELLTSITAYESKDETMSSDSAINGLLTYSDERIKENEKSMKVKEDSEEKDIETIEKYDNLLYVDYCAAALGDIFECRINIDSSESVFAIELEIEYNRSMFEFREIIEGNFLKNNSNIYTQKSASEKGKIEFASTRFGVQTGVSGNGTIAVINFRAISAGETFLNISKENIVDSSLNKMNFDVMGREIRILKA